MILLTDEVSVRMVARVRDHYEKLGYALPEKSTYIQVKVADLHEKSTALVERQCVSCGEIREVRYCERTAVCLPCTRKSFKGENNPAWSGGKTACANCGKTTSNWKSKVCGVCHLKRDQSAENSPSWKGGKGNCDCGAPLSDHRGGQCRECFIRATKKEETVKRQRNKAHKTLVKNVLKRDDYTCDYCGARNAESLEVHHLQGWDENPDLRFEPSNCVTLCKSHHSDFHRIYGYGKNTTKQYREFKEPSI